MGLLDNLLGGLAQGGMGGARQGGSGGGLGGIGGMAIAAIILQLLQRSGGLQGLLQHMQQAGFGQQAQSWIHTGPNEPISPDAISQIFGQGQLSQIARELGLSQDEAASSMAQALPHVVDSMTPQGAIPDDHDDLVERTLQDLMQRR